MIVNDYAIIAISERTRDETCRYLCIYNYNYSYFEFEFSIGIFWSNMTKNKFLH